MVTTLPPSHIARNALRRALRDYLRAQPDSYSAGHTLLAGRLVNDLPLAELKNILATIGLDPDGIAAAALTGQPAAEQPAPVPETIPETTTETIMPDPIDAAIESELADIRGLIGTGGFAALDQRLRELVVAANKPPVEVVREIEIEVPAACGSNGTKPVHRAKTTGSTATWRDLFGVRGALGDRTTTLWDGSHPDTPRVVADYVWPHPAIEIALTQFHRGGNVYLFGPAGTGKTELAQQVAARTGRPFALISCDAGTDAATLVGMTVPDGDGVRWQDGQLTRAIRTPGCVICIDEPSVARAGALMVLQNALVNRCLFIAETGERVVVAPGVLFLATDNTNGTGGGSRRGYADTHVLNAAFLDRFGAIVRVGYLTPAKERALIVGRTGCTPALADLLISAAAVTRAAADNQGLSRHGIGLRRLFSWAALLTDGISAEAAFEAAILNTAPEQDVETLREQCLLAYDRDQVARAIGTTTDSTGTIDTTTETDPCVDNPTAAGRAAAADFSRV